MLPRTVRLDSLRGFALCRHANAVTCTKLSDSEYLCTRRRYIRLSIVPASSSRGTTKTERISTGCMRARTAVKEAAVDHVMGAAKLFGSEVPCYQLGICGDREWKRIWMHKDVRRNGYAAARYVRKRRLPACTEVMGVEVCSTPRDCYSSQK